MNAIKDKLVAYAQSTQATVAKISKSTRYTLGFLIAVLVVLLLVFYFNDLEYSSTEISIMSTVAFCSGVMIISIILDLYANTTQSNKQ